MSALAPVAPAPLAAPAPLTSLRAAACALLLVGLVLGSAAVYGNHLELRSIHFATQQFALERNPETEQPHHINHLERIKNQGISLQSKALRQTDLVSLYGSSELRKPIPDRAGIFFAKYPTGFAVFQVGKAGATSIILLQKIVAAMPAAGPRHVAISLSSTWFLGEELQHYYVGNFSRPQALSVVYNPRLSLGLKRDIAQRMLEFPQTIPADSLLGFAVGHLAADGWWNRVLYLSSQPMGWIDGLICAAQDHLETSLYLLEQEVQIGHDTVERARADLDWDKLLADADHQTPEPPANQGPGRDWEMRGDATYLKALLGSREWGDLEMLLRSFKELGVTPLILSMPPQGRHYATLNVTHAALDQYSQKLHALGEKYGAQVQTFDDHIDDPKFLNDFHDHMSIKGWMYYNKALNDYFHRHR